jgi:hypothetical protein
LSFQIGFDTLGGMKKWVWRLLPIALLLGCLSFVFSTGVSYHATCARCLAQAKGREKKILGLTFGRHLDIAPLARGSSSPAGEPETYTAIFGLPCEHQFKRGGMGWSSMGMIACGQSPEEMAFSARIRAVRALFGLFHRLGNQAYALETYACIDSLLKADAPLKEALASSRYDPDSVRFRLEALADMLDLVSTELKWRQVLSYAQSGFVGTAPVSAR